MNLASDIVWELRGHRGKSVMTGLSLFIGVLAVLLVSIQSERSDTAAQAQSEITSGRAVSIFNQTTIQTPTQLDGAESALNHRIRNGLGGSWILTSPEGEWEVSSPAGPADVIANVELVDGDLAGVRRVLIVDGSVFSYDAGPYPGVAVVNRALAAQLGGVGTTITVGGRVDGDKATPLSYQVIGVIDDRSPTPGLYAQLSTWIATRHDDEISVLATARSSSREEIMADQLDLALDDADVATGQSPTRIDGAQESEYARSVSNRAFAIASLVTLIIAAVGVANIGLSSARERAHEYAIRRAFGYTRRRIVALVLLSNVGLSLAASALAMLVGLAISASIVPGLNSDPLLGTTPFPVVAALLAAGASLLAALAGAIAPAVVASRTPIATLLR